jgi:hypothetical protein
MAHKRFLERIFGMGERENKKNFVLALETYSVSFENNTLGKHSLL